MHDKSSIAIEILLKIVFICSRAYTRLFCCLCISVVIDVLLTIAKVHTKVFNGKKAYKICHLQFLHTKGITALMQFCDFLNVYEVHILQYAI